MDYQDVLDDAYGLSLKTQPDDVATAHPELTGAIFRSLQALYTIAASVNPTFFGSETNETAPGANNGWPKPADAESIFYVEDPAGDEVITVRIGEWEVEPERPKVYSLGGELHTVGGTPDPDPATDALRIFYATGPSPAPTAVSDALPGDFPESHAQILVYQVGMYIATKDIGSQGEELQVIRRERDAALSRFIRRLELDLANVRSQFQQATYAESQSIVSHRALLDGAVGAADG